MAVLFTALPQIAPQPFVCACSEREKNEYLKQENTTFNGNVRVYIERMLMSACYYSFAHAYESIFEIHLQFVLIL